LPVPSLHALKNAWSTLEAARALHSILMPQALKFHATYSMSSCHHSPVTLELILTNGPSTSRESIMTQPLLLLQPQDHAHTSRLPIRSSSPTPIAKQQLLHWIALAEKVKQLPTDSPASG
jgi:hypothetical protein